MRKPENAMNVLATRVLPVALLFVSVAAIVRVVQESQQPVRPLLASLLGPFATIAVLAGMCVVAGVWFMRGDIAFPFRKILALGLVGLPTALLFGVLQPPSLRLSWGGVAGANLGSVVSLLPDTLAAGLSVLLLVISAFIAWRIAFGAMAAPQTAHMALAGIGGSSPMSAFTQPMQATAYLDETETEDALDEVQPLTRQSTLFDTLGDTEDMIRAAEAAANAPLEDEIVATEPKAHVVPPWLVATTTENAEAPIALVLETSIPAAVSGNLLEATNDVVDLDDISDLKPLDGEASLGFVEEELELGEATLLAKEQAGIVEELEDEDLLAEDRTGDYTIETDLEAEVETAPQATVAVAARALLFAEDEFSLAAAEVTPVHATVIPTEPAPTPATAPVAMPTQSDESLLLHPALLALSASKDDAADVIWPAHCETPDAVVEETAVAVEADVAELDDESWMPKPMSVGVQNEELVQDAEELSADFFEDPECAEDIAHTLDAERAEETTLADCAMETLAAEEAPLFAASSETPATAEIETPPPTYHLEAPLKDDPSPARPQFTLLRGGPDEPVTPTELPAHLAPAALVANVPAVASEPAAKPKSARKARQGTTLESWEEGSGRGRRSARAEKRDDADQAFLFTASQVPEAELLRSAEQLVVAEQRCSELMLQRKLEISWSVASRIVEHLVRGGFVGVPDASGRREVLRRGELSLGADNGF